MAPPKKQTLEERVAAAPLNTWVEVPISAITKEEYVELMAPTTIAIDRLLNLHRYASNRDFCIEAALIIERALNEVLKAFFTEQTSESFFGKNGKAGKIKDFELKIDLAYGLGLISSEHQIAINIIRKIRNRFAHDPDLHHFEHDDVVLGAIRSLANSAPAELQLSHRDKLLSTATHLQFTLTQRADIVINERRKQFE
jgi:DNA-binding MltR family transcriptional regulator